MDKFQSARTRRIRKCIRRNRNMIDFKKYGNPEIVNGIADVMSSPQRATIGIVKWGQLFAVLGFVVSVILIYSSKQPVYVAIFSSVFVFFVMFFSGALFGLYLFFMDLNRSFKTILGYTNRVVHLAVNDICDSFDTLKLGIDGCRIKLPGGHEVVGGVLNDVINPAVKKCLESKIPWVGKFVSKIYALIVDGLLKVSSVFFARVDKEIDKAVTARLGKLKGVADAPLNFVENTVKRTWLFKISDGADRYIGKAQGYIRKAYVLISIPILTFAIAFAFVGAVAALVFCGV